MPRSKTFFENKEGKQISDTIKIAYLKGFSLFMQEDSLKIAVHLIDTALIVAIDGQAVGYYLDPLSMMEQEPCHNLAVNPWKGGYQCGISVNEYPGSVGPQII